MAGPSLILIYAALCAVVAWLGRKTVVGFVGCFVLGILLTPFVMALALMVTAPRSKN